MPIKPPTLRPAGAWSRAGYDRQRYQAKPSRKWYNSTAWRKRRKAQLDAEPLCRMCDAGGYVTEATVADHVEPHREDHDRFWHGPLQSLCASCHSSAKQMEEQAAPRRR